MPIRLSGMASGLDTDAIVKELMSAQTLKKTKIEQKKTKAEWKQEKWKDLNTKIYALYTKQVSKMKLQGNYRQKKVTSSDESKVTATATSSAALGSHTLEVKELASSQYVTGSKVENIKVSQMDLVIGDKFEVNGKIYEVTNEATDLENGKVNINARFSELGLHTGDTIKHIKTDANGQDASKTLTITGGTSVTGGTKLADLGMTVGTSNAAIKVTVGGKETKITLGANMTISDLTTKLQELGLNASFDSSQKRFFLSSKESGTENAFTMEYEGSNGESELNKIGLTTITNDTFSDVGFVGDNTAEFAGVTVVKASNAVVVLDGATLEGSSNNFSAAGITLELKDKTNGKVSLSVGNDVDAIYNDIKDLIKEYNNILKEINTLYGAEAAKGYEPLTDEEKEAMSEDQIEKWEKKIKDSLLRRDSTLGGIADAMKSVMQTSVKIDGKSYSLASFGIMTSSDYTEKGLLHIYGDADDDTYADQTNKLKAALTENPEVVEEVLSEVIGKLSSTLMDKMKKTTLSSALTFYNDIEMKNQIKGYEDEIDKWEDKLKDMEDRYYKQFSAMESAMMKLNNQSSSLFGMTSGGQ